MTDNMWLTALDKANVHTKPQWSYISVENSICNTLYIFLFLPFFEFKWQEIDLKLFHRVRFWQNRSDIFLGLTLGISDNSVIYRFVDMFAFDFENSQAFTDNRYEEQWTKWNSYIWDRIILVRRDIANVESFNRINKRR